MKRGRPSRAATPSDRRLVVLFTVGELAELDRLRGDVSRSEFLRKKALEGWEAKEEK